jgi:hypothetical protein
MTDGSFLRCSSPGCLSVLPSALVRRDVGAVFVLILVSVGRSLEERLVQNCWHSFSLLPRRQVIFLPIPLSSFEVRRFVPRSTRRPPYKLNCIVLPPNPIIR